MPPGPKQKKKKIPREPVSSNLTVITAFTGGVKPLVGRCATASQYNRVSYQNEGLGQMPGRPRRRVVENVVNLEIKPRLFVRAMKTLYNSSVALFFFLSAREWG